jgi:hypothetical protein
MRRKLKLLLFCVFVGVVLSSLLGSAVGYLTDVIQIAVAVQIILEAAYTKRL